MLNPKQGVIYTAEHNGKRYFIKLNKEGKLMKRVRSYTPWIECDFPINFLLGMKWSEANQIDFMDKVDYKRAFRAWLDGRDIVWTNDVTEVYFESDGDSDDEFVGYEKDAVEVIFHPNMIWEGQWHINNN